MPGQRLEVVYGGHDCCATAGGFAVTRADATGSVTYRVCVLHRDECAATQSRYVSGWGDVALSVRRVAPPAPSSSSPGAAAEECGHERTEQVSEHEVRCLDCGVVSA